MKGLADKCEKLLNNVHLIVRENNKISKKKDTIITAVFIESPDGTKQYFLYGSNYSETDVGQALFLWANYEREEFDRSSDDDNNSMLK